MLGNHAVPSVCRDRQLPFRSSGHGFGEGVAQRSRDRGILGDMRGNDNLLCESDEVCLFTPNLASYQGEGAIVPPEGFIFVNGAISNVTLLEHETNGTMIPYRP